MATHLPNYKKLKKCHTRMKKIEKRDIPNSHAKKHTVGIPTHGIYVALITS